jgi:NADH-quinone oxidoreductase subunit I
MGILRKTASGVKGMIEGMGITFGHFVHLDQIITQQYPENRATLKMAERFRGRLELTRDAATGAYKCTACGLCVRACPNNSLQVEKERDPETKKFRLTQYIYHFERCTLCALCVDACKFEAIRMGQRFENAVYDRRQLTVILNDAPPAPVAAPAAAAAPAAPAADAAPAGEACPAPPAAGKEGGAA